MEAVVAGPAVWRPVCPPRDRLWMAGPTGGWSVDPPTCPPDEHRLSTDPRPSVHRPSPDNPQSCPQMWVKVWSHEDGGRPGRRGRRGRRGRGGPGNSQFSLAAQGAERSVTATITAHHDRRGRPAPNVERSTPNGGPDGGQDAVRFRRVGTTITARGGGDPEAMIVVPEPCSGAERVARSATTIVRGGSPAAGRACEPCPRRGSGAVSAAGAVSVAGALLDARREFLDLFEGLAALGDLVADLLVRVHDGGVVATAEGLPDTG